MTLVIFFLAIVLTRTIALFLTTILLGMIAFSYTCNRLLTFKNDSQCKQSGIQTKESSSQPKERFNEKSPSRP